MFRYRPLSPHLTIYNIQFSSLFSIWHRITGILNFLILFSSLLMFKLFLWSFIIDIISIFQVGYVILKWLIGIVYLSFLYHVLNGYRHLMWDLDIFLTSKGILKSTFLLICILLGIFIYNWIFSF